MHAKEVYELLIALGAPSLLALAGVAWYLFYEADERHLLDWLKPSPRPPAETPAPVRHEPPRPPEPLPRVEPQRTVAPARADAPAAKDKPTVKPFSSAITNRLVEEQMRREAQQAVAGSPERLRRLNVLIAEREAIIRSGDTPPPCTAQELLSQL